MKRSKANNNYYIFPLSIFFLTLFIYYFTSIKEPTPYNNFVLLADAILNGRLYLLNDINWIELAVYNGKYFIIPPPMPAILILPIVKIYGLETNQAIISIFFGSLNVTLAYFLTRKFIANIKTQLWCTALFGFGTITWWVAISGGVWTFSQTVSVTFFLLAILSTANRINPFFTGLLLGASYWSRLPTILSIPFFILTYIKKDDQNTGISAYVTKENLYITLKFGLGVSVFVILNFIYNHLRFDTIWDISYYLKPGIFEEPWYRKGIFDLSYIPKHLEVIFLNLPKKVSGIPYLIPSWDGLAIWITTPAFIFAFFNRLRDKEVLGAWISILLILFIEITHGSWGFTQFGYRFAVDFYPLLFLLTVKGIGKNVRWYHMVLITLGIFVNLWGVLCIKYGFAIY